MTPFTVSNHSLDKPFLRDTTTEWQTTSGENEVTCHSRMIGGVLCRWWGKGEAPSGVALLDAAFPVKEHL